MAQFGINVRGRTAPLGNVSVQSVQAPAASPTSAVLKPGTIIPGGLATVRTINPEILSPTIIGNLRLPPVVRFIPPLILPPKKQYQQDTLRVSQFRVANATFEPVEKNGISAFRPEIVSIMDFKPIDGKRTLGSTDVVESAEQLVKTQYQAIELRAVTLQKLMTDIRSRSSFRPLVDSIKNRYVNGLVSTKVALNYFSNLIDKIDDVKDSLDPKKIPSTAYDTATFLPLIDFYERKMQYPKSKYANFSDTKIINQLISDFRNILEGYSLSLLDLTDSDRGSDHSPTVLDKTYTQTSGFTFTVSSIRSETEAENAFKPAFLNPFLNSLPSNPDDRIKLLVHLISKELRVSKQLGRPDVVRQLQQRFGQGDTGNPFDNVIGTPGDTIFDVPLGQNSLSNLTNMQLDGNMTVLPLESVYVDSENERKVYVPGSTYFVDTILDVSATGFNTQPYTTYANRFNEITSNVKNAVETLLDLNSDSKLSPEAVYDSFLSSIAESISGTGAATGMNRGQAISAALFRLANTDTTLKNQLFEYLLLLGLASVTNSDQKKVFERLAWEVKSIRNFTTVRSSRTDNPSLNGGMAALRPYIEGLADDIESQVFSLISPIRVRLPSDYIRTVPSLRPLQLDPSVSTSTNVLAGGVGTRILNTAGIIGNLRLTSFYLSFRRGEIKETLVNNVSTVGNASSNLCKEFIDLAVKLDQLASVSANAVYLMSDGTARTRFNFLSTSTQLLLIFETLSSFANRYAFADFNKGGNLAAGSITIDTSMNSGIMQVIRDIVAVKPTFLFNPVTATRSIRVLANEVMTTSRPAPRAPFSLFNADSARESLRMPFTSGRQSAQNSSMTPSIFTPAATTTLPASANIQSLLNTPAFGFGRIFDDLILPLDFLPETMKLIGYRKTLVSNRSKLQDENLIVRNVLHIFSVLNRRLTSSKESIVNTFTLASLNNIMRSTGITLEDVQIVRNPSQVRVSAWLLDRYDERTSDISNADETTDGNRGFLVTDRVPANQLNVMFTMMHQPKYRYTDQADFKVKLLTVGIPAGFSKTLSDRVSRTAINETNFKEKQFDVIAIDVYKRDARYDDLVFKPQRFFFDLSLFPVRNFLPPTSSGTNVNYAQVLREAQLRDYQSIQDKRLVSLRDIRNDQKYSFLSDLQKQQMMQNHVESQLLDLYIRLMTGLKMDEEVFTGTRYDKLNLQDQEVFNLAVRFLKEVKGKDIPNLPIEQILLSQNVDQETKDTLRLLSYGNVVFQSNFVRRRILDPKLFDRVFNIPISIDDFPIDVAATIATDSGRETYMKNSIQEQIVRTNGEEYLRPRNRNDMVFEDYFVVVESNLRGGT